MNDQQKYLNQVRIATPCSADWDKMDGDDRMRHCEQCNLDVFNISEMTLLEATELIQNRTGRLCIQMYKRRDGTVITKDCPKGLERVRNSYRKCAAAAAGFFAWSLTMVGIASPALAQQEAGDITPTSKSCKTLRGKVAPMKEMGEAVMGDVAVPPVENNTKETVPVVEKVNITETPPVNTASACALKVKPNNRPLALGLSLAAVLAAATFIFAKLKKRASLWLVGTSFATACIAVGLIWHWLW